MKDFLKKNGLTFAIVVATIVLAGVAIFTALRLYSLRGEPVAPTAPTSQPEAFGETPQPTPCEYGSCTKLAFTLSTPTPTGTPTSTPTSSPTPTPTSNATSTPNPTNTPTNSPTQPPIGGIDSTPQPELPEAGIAAPTLIGIGLGGLLLIFAIALVL